MLPYLLLSVLTYLLIGFTMNRVQIFKNWRERQFKKVDWWARHNFIMKNTPLINTTSRQMINKKHRLLVVVGYPIIFLMVIFHSIKKRWLEKKSEKMKPSFEEIEFPVIKNKNFLYLEDLKGPGILKCKVCSHKERMVSLEQRRYGEKYNIKEYQCQGDCRTIFKLDRNDLSNKSDCDYFLCNTCNAEIKMNVPLSCPKCHSYLLDFKTIEVPHEKYKDYLWAVHSSQHINDKEIDENGFSFRRIRDWSDSPF